MDETADTTPAELAAQPLPAGAIARQATELLACGALSMSPGRVADAREVAGWLPAGTRVYVDHLPGHGLAGSQQALLALHEAGLEPVPHLAARRIASQRELADFLRVAVERAGVSKALLIGGDASEAGPFADAAALLREPLLAEHGVREVGLAGYPEGHPTIPRAALRRALADKLELAARHGLGAHLVTQFSFAPARVVEYCGELARELPRLPVYVGMAGPISAAGLMRFAQRCGVSASLRALGAQGMGAVRRFMHTDPGEQLSVLAQHALRHPDGNVVGAHLYSFGSAARTAEWMNRIITGHAGGPG